MKIIKKFIFLAACLLGAACGGGGGSDSDGIIFEGELTQGEAVEHAARGFKHGAGEPIGEVAVCALGRCSTTDSKGLYGFVGPKDFTGGDILFTVEGHGIQASSVVNVPSTAKSVYLHFETSASTEVHVHHMTVDGSEVAATSESTETDDGHEHAHE